MENKLAQYRFEKGLSLAKLSELCGVSKSHLNKIEQGEREPTVLVAYAISRALSLSIYEVFPDRH